ncbi:MAG: porin family protein [Chitinophagaceae bacterium]
MKKIHLLLVAVMLISLITANAQTIPSFGIRAGVAFTNWQGDAVQSLDKLVNVSDGIVDTRSKTGFFAGGYMNIPVSHIFSVEPGIYFTQKGYTMNGNLEIKAIQFLGADAIARVQSSYIDLPLLIRANISGGLQAYAGPQISYLAKNNLHLDAGIIGISLFQRDVDMTDNFKRWDAGITGGLAYQFQNGLNIQAGYEHGLSRVDAQGNFKSYNRVVKVGLGFTF